MAIKKILTDTHPLIRKKAAPVTTFDQRLTQIIQDIEDTMYAAGGQALSAPQIGIPLQIAMVDMEQDGLLQLINPEIVRASDTTTTELEGCLSVPNRFGEVTRSQMITVKSKDIYGRDVELTAYDDIARMILHEIDNLNGVLFTDIMDREITEKELEAYYDNE
ncbi:peptide deformylase [Staphylococcus agnetis]|uniref:Peptide deformylase-like n=1 Tax=Staphylococcus agnetis TaxID=985762 RepID=A0A2T4MKB4_9STAP|nr:peptide deformylase [Staphylococcus agnetis]MCO4338257.1 peptide deformylase [Staphylococcus agnetis]MCO4341345.1 peptide deformylase [Staphylococcus agnetis]MCO4343332.1 peptide deformylase [Staphylococcus agnetis]MCO4345327.1 peptide deformylase [Staphylococcus agnetis]MCO4348407.1 peptide deformylase [Staphylococcus agnetis]